MSVLDEISEEQDRQVAKWGEQNHPDGTGQHWEHMHGQHAGAAEENREDATGRCMRWFTQDGGTWSLILEEEVAEALAESDPQLLRAELIQVAAVAVSWVEAIDRRTPRQPGVVDLVAALRASVEAAADCDASGPSDQWPCDCGR